LIHDLTRENSAGSVNKHLANRSLRESDFDPIGWQQPPRRDQNKVEELILWRCSTAENLRKDISLKH